MKIPLINNIENKISFSYTKINSVTLLDGSDKPNILLVEDNNLNQKIAILLLKQIGIDKIDIAQSGFEAINLVTQNRYSFVLLDIGLPDINGFDVAKIVRNSQLNSYIPIIAITAFDRNDIDKQCIKVGINRILSKPLQIKELEEIFCQTYDYMGSLSYC